jgi:hypothetical protein
VSIATLPVAALPVAALPVAALPVAALPVAVRAAGRRLPSTPVTNSPTAPCIAAVLGTVVGYWTAPGAPLDDVLDELPSVAVGAAVGSAEPAPVPAVSVAVPGPVTTTVSPVPVGPDPLAGVVVVEPLADDGPVDPLAGVVRGCALEADAPGDEVVPAGSLEAAPSALTEGAGALPVRVPPVAAPLVAVPLGGGADELSACDGGAAASAKNATSTVPSGKTISRGTARNVKPPDLPIVPPLQR